jgi:hypothetical protein
MPTIDLTDAELAAVTAAIRRAIEQDKFPHALRLDPLRTALAKLEADKTQAAHNHKSPPTRRAAHMKRPRPPGNCGRGRRHQ